VVEGGSMKASDLVIGQEYKDNTLPKETFIFEGSFESGIDMWKGMMYSFLPASEDYGGILCTKEEVENDMQPNEGDQR